MTMLRLLRTLMAATFRRQRWSLVVSVVLLAASAAVLEVRSHSACDSDGGGLEFDDVASLTVLSSVVFHGKPVRDKSDGDLVIFRVRQIYKGAGLFQERPAEQSTTAHVRMSSEQCAISLRAHRRRLLVFLNGSRTYNASDDRPPIYWSMAPPVKFSERSVKIVKQHSCSGCGAYICCDGFALSGDRAALFDDRLSAPPCINRSYTCTYYRIPLNGRNAYFSICLSVRPSQYFSHLLEIGKPQKVLIYWRGFL